MIDLEKFFDNQMDEHSEVLLQTKINVKKVFVNLVEKCSSCIKSGKKIIFIGNGGSAADAQHLSTELTVRFSKNRKSIAAISLATDTSALTAIGNDLGFEKIFSRQLEAIGSSGDILIAISTSGNSKNIISAVNQANDQGIEVFVFTGNDGGDLASISKNIIYIPSNKTARIQEMHITIGQILCSALEQNLGLV
ncbi:SIS domain-containing protein [Alphaproteobacteria bacterium]|nr:SIS domain-containing protein [Alphaproteobacteria bacterium]